MYYFTTYFDKNYLSRGLALYDSLNENLTNFRLYILCLDEFTINYFKENSNVYPNVNIIQLSELELFDKELKNSKSNRSLIEYYFTLSPCLPLYILKEIKLPHICSLDADILFFDSPSTIFDKLEKYSIIITPHKFSKENIDLKIYGIYNVSFQIFKNNYIGLECLKKWREECLEFCDDEYDKVGDRFADQKYLDKWTKLYPDSVYELNDNSSGLAIWNINNYEVRKKEGKFYSNSESIIFYHFHHFKIFNASYASNGFYNYKVKAQESLDDLYLFYWQKLEYFNNLLNLEKDNSVRYTSKKKIISNLFKEKIVYKRKNNILRWENYKFIPKIIRKLVIKIYA